MDRRERYFEKVAGIPDELKDKAKMIVELSKKDARVDTGRLKRSISYVINLQGVFTFTEVFYGQFGENSDLEENIKRYWPKEQPFNLIYTDDNGAPYQVVRKTSSGRASVQSNATKATTQKSLGINGIKNFLTNYGEKKNEIKDS